MFSSCLKVLLVSSKILASCIPHERQLLKHKGFNRNAGRNAKKLYRRLICHAPLSLLQYDNERAFQPVFFVLKPKGKLEAIGKLTAFISLKQLLHQRLHKSIKSTDELFKLLLRFQETRVMLGYTVTDQCLQG